MTRRKDSATAPVLAPGDTAKLLGPRQPIFFRHDIHAGQYKMECQYCHYSVAVSPEPGIPSVQTCMGCHLVIGGRDSSHQAEVKKLRADGEVYVCGMADPQPLPDSPEGVDAHPMAPSW